jgi:leucyl aminopeptidase (aminopeptidase T)
MPDIRLRRLADVLVNYSIAIQPDEWVPLAKVFARPTIPQLEQDFRALGLL